MSEPLSPLHRGSLAARIREVTARAERDGALETITTTAEVIEEEGIPFVVRCVSSLARKDRARRRPVPDNPFLPPDPALTLGAMAPRHVAVLNKFNVLSHHVLLVTDTFRHQEELLDRDSFRVLWWGLGELPSLGFYNGGEAAGASQPHQHLQLVPLPLGADSDVPMAARLETAGSPPGEPEVRDAPFRHAFARLPALAAEEEAAERCHRLYRAVLDLLGLAPASATRQSAPYNLLLTRRFLLVVPRTAEHFEDISINALGFAGSLFVRTPAQLARIRRVGPLSVLRAVVRG